VRVASSSAESLSCFVYTATNCTECHKPANCPHKLTKTAEPWLGGGAALSGSELHAAVTSAAVRSRYCMLVAAAAAPSVGDRHGRRSLQLRVSSLGGYAWTCQINSAPVAVLAPSARPPLTPSARTMSVRAPFRSMLHKG
jgi:hypothetical protein